MAKIAQDPVIRFLSKVLKTEGGCWLWLGGTFKKSGYGRFKHDGKGDYAHRYSYAIHKGAIPPNKVVRHSCDNVLCVNPAHLIAGTHQDNTDDREAHGRTARGLRAGALAHPERLAKGEGHGMSKLTRDQVIMIRRLHDAKARTITELARDCNVNPSTISVIVRRKAWKHIP